MVDVCDKLHCEKLHINSVELSFVDDIVDRINMDLYLDDNYVGLVSDGHGNITTKRLPKVFQDHGVVKVDHVGIFEQEKEVTIPYITTFTKTPKVFINLLFSLTSEGGNNARYIRSSIIDLNSNNATIASYFKTNKLNTLLVSDVSETKCVNLHYSGYGIVVNDGKALLFINNQSFDGKGPYQYHTIINDVANPRGYSSILSVDGYPMIAYSRKENNHLILGICNSLSGLGKWSMTTNNTIGLYPNLIVTETRQVSIINYDGYNLVSSIIDDGVWLSSKIDPISSLTGISACNVDKYYVMVATKANSSSDCRVYFSDPSCTSFKLSLTSTEVWLNTDVGVLFDNRPVVIASSLNGIKMYYNQLVNGEGQWNSVKLTDDIPSELVYLLLGNGDSMVAYYTDNNLVILYGNMVVGEWKTFQLGNVKNISCTNTHNGYVHIAGSSENELVSILSANKYSFAEEIKDYLIYWYAVDTELNA
jgi:hypothetical protein